MRDERELTDADDIELESALEELALNLGCDAVETDMALRVNGRSGHRRHLSGCWINLAARRSLFQKEGDSRSSQGGDVRQKTESENDGVRLAAN